MGIYIQSGDEIIDKFESFLINISCDGDVNAFAIAGAFNKLANKWDWEDRLQAKHKKYLE